MVINDWKQRDKAQGESFAVRLQTIIDEIKKETEVTVETIKQLIELIKSMNGKSATPESLTSDFEKALWNNRSDWTKLDNDAAIELILTISEYFQIKSVRWLERPYSSCRLQMSERLNKILGENSNEEQIYAVHSIAANNL